MSRPTLGFGLYSWLAVAGAVACGLTATGTGEIDGAAGPEQAAAPTEPAAEGGPSTRADAAAPDAEEACVPRDTDAPPKDAAYPVKLSGQDAWIHDEGSPAGYFHTYDGLVVGAGAERAPRKIHVFLPRSYTTGCKRYPVLYFHDGNTTFFPGGAGNKSWGVADVLAKGYAAGSFGEVIVVAVHPLEREREYTHAPWLPGRSCCGVSGYVGYLAGALKGFVDGAYRTRAGSADTVVVGSSHGGLAAFYAASTRPDVFGKAIAMSSSFWAGLDDRGAGTIGGPLATSALLQAASPGLTASRPRLYLDWGLVRTGGVHNAIIEERATARGQEMAQLLSASYGYTVGKDLFTVEDAQGEHDEISWGRRLGPALSLVLGP